MTKMTLTSASGSTTSYALDLDELGVRAQPTPKPAPRPDPRQPAGIWYTEETVPH